VDFSPPPACCCLAGCLGLVALDTDRLQVVFRIRAALLLGSDMVDLLCWAVLASSKADLAQALVAPQDDLAQLVPLRAVAAFLAAASTLIGELVDLPVCLMRLAVARPIPHQG